MRPLFRLASLAFAAACVLAAPAAAQMQPPSPNGTPEVRAAIDRLDALDGEWAGPTWVLTPDGSRRELRHTERVGDLLGGAIKLVEGRGYGPGGETEFNAFAVITFNARTGAYAFSTFVGGEKHEFPLQVTEDGFVWERPAGAKAIVRFTARVKDGRWREVGEYIAEGREPVRIVELDLKRTGDSAWPAAGAVDPARGR